MATTKVAIVRDKRRSSSWAVRWYGVPNIDNGRVVRYSQAFRKRADAARFHAEKQGENGSRWHEDFGGAITSYLPGDGMPNHRRHPSALRPNHSNTNDTYRNPYS